MVHLKKPITILEENTWCKLLAPPATTCSTYTLQPSLLHPNPEEAEEIVDPHQNTVPKVQTKEPHPGGDAQRHLPAQQKHPLTKRLLEIIATSYTIR